MYVSCSKGTNVVYIASSMTSSGSRTFQHHSIDCYIIYVSHGIYSITISRVFKAIDRYVNLLYK